MTDNDFAATNGSGVSRRRVLAVGAAGATVALAACSKANTAATASSVAAPTDTAASSAAAPGGAVLAKLSDIKVGGAISAKGPDGAKILIARPTQTTVAAFSAVCTHMGCTVAPAGKELDCPCHGSRYNAATGEVIGGPAPRALPPVAVKISGGNVIAG